MKIAVISDIHGNLEALKKVKLDIDRQGVTKILCLGDIVGYGPHPIECLNYVKSFADTILRGNHEQALIDTREMAQEALNDLAYGAIEFTRSKTSEIEIAYFKSLPVSVVMSELNLTIAHGSAILDKEWVYVDKESLIKQELKNLTTQVCLLGHTHSPLVYGSVKGLYKYLPELLVLDKDEKYIINVGSVGQPRDGDCRSSYGIIDINGEEISFSLQRVFYNIEKTENAMRAAKLNPFLYERLYCGD